MANHHPPWGAQPSPTPPHFQHHVSLPTAPHLQPQQQQSWPSQPQPRPPPSQLQPPLIREPQPGLPQTQSGPPQPQSGRPQPQPGLAQPQPGPAQPHPRPAPLQKAPGAAQPWQQSQAWLPPAQLQPLPGQPLPQSGLARPQPGLPQPQPQPGLAQPQPQPGLPQPQPQTGLAQPQPQPGLAQPQPQPGLVQPQPQPGLAQPQPQPGLAQPQPQPGLPRQWLQPQPGLPHSQPHMTAVPPRPQAQPTSVFAAAALAAHGTPAAQPTSHAKPAPTSAAASGTAPHAGGRARTLEVSLSAVRDDRRPEKASRALAKVLVPADLIATAQAAVAALADAHLNPGHGARHLRVMADQYPQLVEMMGESRVQLKPAHPIEQAALAYRPPLSEAEAEVAIGSALRPELLDALFPFQREGVAFAVRHGGRCLIADEMGLGKTVQALATALCYPSDWPVLVLCPASLCANWHTEAVKWLSLGGVAKPEALVHYVKGGRDRLQAEGARGGAGVSIVSYDLGKQLAERLGAIGFGVVICDESHNLKSGESKRSKALLPLVAAARRAVLLSGTPVLSRPIEIFTCAAALRPAIYGAQREFAKRYCNGHQGKFGWDEKGSSHLEALSAVLAHTLMVRREKASVLTQLPAKIRQTVHIELPHKDYARISRRMAELVAASDHSDAPEHNPLLTELYQESGLAKLSGVLAHVETLLASDTELQLILFAHHQEMIDAIGRHLMQKRFEFVRIDGKTATDLRQQLVQRFQRDKLVRVALLSINAAGVGLTLTAAKVVVFAELSWNVSFLQQAEDRAHRIGQRNSVLVQYLLADGSLDDWMWRTVERKLVVTGSALNGHDASASSSFAQDAGEASRPAVSAASMAAAAAERGVCPPGRGDIRGFFQAQSAASGTVPGIEDGTRAHEEPSASAERCSKRRRSAGTLAGEPVDLTAGDSDCN